MYKTVFFIIMMMGTLISISSMSWLMIWMGLEINLLSLMPLMKNLKNKLSSESTIKYFIVQTMASSLFLFSMILFTNYKTLNIQMNEMSSLMLNSTLIMKMGAAPFHFWLPEVISGLSWDMCFIILTWQKIAPMVILMYSTLTSTYLSSIIILSVLISGIQGMNQTCFRKLLAFSSINHMSWMLSAMMSSMTIWMYYLIIYFILNFNIMFMLNKYNVFYMPQLTKLMSHNKNIKCLYMMNFLSLGGLPPFMGFLPKWLTINFLINNNFYLLSIILVIFTLMPLFIYIRITMTTFLMNQSESLMNMETQLKFMYMLILIISLNSLFLYTTMILIN
uniref:NADH-ubiquinone oxidoreductase chain 2 n=1 Tax=Mecinus janthinus TaxID=1071889 RepID=A0A343C4X4_9CUCU|nr:NADH dehydrogenase subunit 2 [Mecinus janthinus]